MCALPCDLLALLYPERCAACDALGLSVPGLCARCSEALYPLGAACPVCAEPEDAPLSVLCVRCRRHSPPFGRVHAPWRYGGELATAIRRMKYGGARGGGRADLVRPLAALFAAALAAAIASGGCDLMVPVPLHPARLRERGFCQASELARAALRRLPGTRRIRLEAAALVRIRATAVQAGLGLTARAANVRGAFVVPSTARRRIEGRRILVIDDVVTTTATAAACARALLTGGARTVDILALARAEG